MTPFFQKNQNDFDWQENLKLLPLLIQMNDLLNLLKYKTISTLNPFSEMSINLSVLNHVGCVVIWVVWIRRYVSCDGLILTWEQFMDLENHVVSFFCVGQIFLGRKLKYFRVNQVLFQILC